MYCTISFLTHDNAGLFGLITLLIILVLVIYRINIWAESVRVKKQKEFDEFLIRYDERQAMIDQDLYDRWG